MVEVAAMARGAVEWVGDRRQGVVFARLLGEVVRVMAYDNRR